MDWGVNSFTDILVQCNTKYNTQAEKKGENPCFNSQPKQEIPFANQRICELILKMMNLRETGKRFL